MPRNKSIAKAQRLRLPRVKKTRAQIRAEACAVLGIDEVDIIVSRKIEPVLKEAGVLTKIWAYLAESATPEARRLLEAKGKLGVEQFRALPFEAFCLAAKVDVDAAFQVIAGAAFSHGEQAAILKQTLSMPLVMEATIKAAKKPDGKSERALLLRQQKQLPGAKPATPAAAAPAPVEAGVLLSPIEDHVKLVTECFAEQFPPRTMRAGEVLDIDLAGEDDLDEEGQDDEQLDDDDGVDNA